jgi:hypothetical protein
MIDIDCSDCGATVKVGLRTRISLYNHLRAFLITEITRKGFAAEDPKLFNMLTIEEAAMRMADQVAKSVEAAEFHDPIIATPTGPEFVEELIDENLADVKTEYLKDDVFVFLALTC